MVVGELAEPADVVVLGAGSGGCTVALAAARTGADVVLVDADGADGVGGTCLNVGCVPSKALIALASAAARIPDLAAMGLKLQAERFDLALFQSWKRELIRGLRAQLQSSLASAGVRLIAGRGRFTRKDRLAIDVSSGPVRYVKFGHAVIATGSRPMGLATLPFAPGVVLDSSDLLSLQELPSQLCVVGAGYIGIELGMAFARLGVPVTLVEAQVAVLPDFDARLVRPVQDRLGELGVEALLGCTVTGGDAKSIELEQDGLQTSLEVDKVLVAVGRKPNTEELGLEHIGAELDPSGRVVVDDSLRAGENTFAIGDVVTGPPVAHKAYAEARVAVANINGEQRTTDHLAIPLVVFSDPEIGSVGASEADAQHLGFETVVARQPFAGSERAATLRQQAGFASLVVDAGTDRVVGAHVVGPHASEMIAEASLALEMIASPTDLAETIHAHPTLAESWAEAARVVA